MGGLTGATDVIYLLNNTDFAVSQVGHQAVKKALLTMRFGSVHKVGDLTYG